MPSTVAGTTVSSCGIDQKLNDALELIKAAQEEAAQSCACSANGDDNDDDDDDDDDDDNDNDNDDDDNDK